MANFLDSIPKVTKNLLIINILAYLATITLVKSGFDMNDMFGLHYYESDSFKPFQIITYMFLHASFSHLFFNMFALWMFGRIIEEILGQSKYLFFYFTCGIGAGLVQELAWSYDIPNALQGIAMKYETVLSAAETELIMSRFITVGASGAIFGLLLAFAMLLPNQPIFFMFIPVPIKAKYFVIIYALIELWGGVAASSGDNVAHFAHLGGMIFGFFLLKYWQNKYKNQQMD
ncbi:MAG: rhomboid family intramembrane serine protease [Paludibacteraceae bacterium]|jgi:membrane associated rhomboid family serine protease|nr:rhomboid family intramembrane serine protease [Paludibacteraceae bacterium]MBQ2051787.1 rhomboid family intramembrane serine protease [Paludibacteraceae bacterium]MBQ2591234.1 rhomboid family intramembrane serine protease [Paludibacteraceae bacterium]MBQ3895717.1 rhomboid family intramembrane serine protease [Paludibacteraceae bacterium]